MELIGSTLASTFDPPASSPRQPEKCGHHTVQFYEDDSELVASVAEFVGVGLESGSPGIVIATEQHRASIEQELRDRGIDLERMVASDLYVSMDAEETLETFVREGVLQRELFRHEVVGHLTRLSALGAEPKLFGEMVALLHRQVGGSAVIELENLWNELMESYRFELYCAYPLQDFANGASSDLFSSICNSHTDVVPADGVDVEGPEEQHKVLAKLQQKSKALAGEIQHRRTIERELQMFVDTALFGLHWVRADGIIEWANAAEMKMLGYEPDEFIGHNISEFHADKDVIEDILARLSRDERLCDYQARLKCKDGSIKIVRITSSVLWEGDQFVHTQCFTRDVTQEVEGERSTRRLAAIVEFSDDAIISKDLNGVITSWNKAAERIFAYTESEAIGRPILMLIPQGRTNEEPEILSRIRRGEVVDHYETVRQRKDGTLIDISVTISPIRDSYGVIVGASKIARDITAQRQTQRELEKLTAELQAAKAELEARVEARTTSLKQAVAQMEEISYTISHDLRAPLRAMNMYSRVLLEEFGPLVEQEPEALRYLNRIAINCSRLDRMVQDVLTFGRVSREGITLEPVSLDRLVSDLIQYYPSLQPPNANLHVEHLGCVIGHEPSLAQVLSNLLVNAVKFVPDGTTPEVRVRAKRANGLVRVWIEDNGIGIDPRFQHRLFAMFERLQPENGYEGTGVGLAIARKATERMGGTIGVESDGKKGCRFWFELPAARKQRQCPT